MRKLVAIDITLADKLKPEFAGKYAKKLSFSNSPLPYPRPYIVLVSFYLDKQYGIKAEIKFLKSYGDLLGRKGSKKKVKKIDPHKPFKKIDYSKYKDVTKADCRLQAAKNMIMSRITKDEERWQQGEYAGLRSAMSWFIHAQRNPKYEKFVSWMNLGGIEDGVIGAMAVMEAPEYGRWFNPLTRSFTKGAIGNKNAKIWAKHRQDYKGWRERCEKKMILVGTRKRT